MLGLQMCLAFCRFWGFKFNFSYLSSKCLPHWAKSLTHMLLFICSFRRGSQDMHGPWQTQWSVAVGIHSNEQISNMTETPACHSIHLLSSLMVNFRNFRSHFPMLRCGPWRVGRHWGRWLPKHSIKGITSAPSQPSFQWPDRIGDGNQ